MKTIKDMITFAIPGAIALGFANTQQTVIVVIILSLVCVIMRIVDRHFLNPFYDEVRLEMIKKEIRREKERILKRQQRETQERPQKKRK